VITVPVLDDGQKVFRHDIPRLVFENFAHQGLIVELGEVSVVTANQKKVDAKVVIAPVVHCDMPDARLGWLRRIFVDRDHTIERVELHASREVAMMNVAEGVHPRTIMFIECRRHESGDPTKDVIVRSEVQRFLVLNDCERLENAKSWKVIDPITEFVMLLHRRIAFYDEHFQTRPTDDAEV
jgi:hypothetical protein